jgi:antitoxin HicB
MRLTMIRYPVNLERDDLGNFLVSFPDVPGALTFGSDRDEALARAVDALESMLMAIVDDREPVPPPSPVRRARPFVTLPALTESKLRLYSAMRAAGVGKAELARRLNCHLPQVDRLLNLSHNSRLDQIEAAFRVLGKRLVIGVEDAA